MWSKTWCHARGNSIVVLGLLVSKNQSLLHAQSGADPGILDEGGGIHGERESILGVCGFAKSHVGLLYWLPGVKHLVWESGDEAR